MSGSKPIPIISYECPKCKADYEPRGKSHSLAAVCEKCQTYFGFGKWNKEEATFHQNIEPTLPLYAKGRIQGVLWQILGFVVKRDRKYRSQWREYCMFNPVEGLAFLSEYNGHWNFIRPLAHGPVKHPSDSSFAFQGFNYDLFQKYNAEIVSAKGEFTFDIFNQADQNRNFEYIAPPYMLGQEVSNTTQLWYKGEFISGNEVADAFQVEHRKLPPRSGVGATQPVMNMSFSENSLVVMCLILVSLVIMLQLYMGNSSQETVVLNETYYLRDLPKDEKVFVTPSFTLKGNVKSVSVKIKAPVDNDWFYADLVLVNESTGEEYNFSHEVAYYHGYDDGNWSEGSTVGEAFLSSIPGSSYHIVIYPQFSNTPSFNISAIRDVSMPSNMFITIGGILLFPLGYYLYRRNRDKKRWSESDYSPFESD